MFDGRLLAGTTVFAAVVEAGSIARAAEALGLTPSAVSRALSRLEARVGVRLLERTTRSLSLTEAGRRFHARAVPLVAGIEEAAAEASGAAGLVGGRLRVNVDPFFARIVLAARLPRFLDAHPAVSVELLMRDAVGDLVADGFDLALRFGEPTVESFVARKLVETRVLTVASPGYLAAHGRPAHPRDVARHRCIEFHDAGNRRPFAWEFRRGDEVVAVRVAGRLTVSDVGTMLSACAAGAGIAQILELGSEELVASGRVVELFPDWTDERFPLHALYPSRQHQPAKVRAFLDFCLDAVQRPR